MEALVLAMIANLVIVVDNGNVFNFHSVIGKCLINLLSWLF